jgi:O-antigen/teichoic acid export membrane protein
MIGDADAFQLSAEGSGRQARQIATSTLWQMGSQITMAALSIVTIKLVTLGLSLELAGLYNSAYGFLQIFGILADFGLYAVAVRELSKAKDREKTLGALLSLRGIILLIALGSALLIAWTVPAWQGTPLPLGITLAAAVPLFTLLAGMIRAAFQVAYKMHFVFVAEVAQRIITLGLTVALIAWGVRNSVDPFVYHLFMSIGGVGALLLLAVSLLYGSRIVRIRPHWDKPLIRQTLRVAAPFGLAFLATTLYRQTDVTLIALLRGDYASQNAYYGFVQRIMDMAYLLPTFLLNSTLPILSQRLEKKEETRGLLGKTFAIVVLMGLVSFLFAIFWPRELMLLLTNEQYVSTAAGPGSDTALSILSVSMFFNGLIVYAFYVLLACHAWRSLVLVLLCGAAASLGLNLWLIPSQGFIGAAITSAIIHAAIAIVLVPLSYRALPFHLPLGTAARLVGFALLTSGYLLLMSPFLANSLWTAAALGLAIPVMGGIVWILGLFQRLR